MATVIRGKLRGQTVELLQWCNDWFSVKTPDGPRIVSPGNLEFDECEWLIVETSFLATTSGTMRYEYSWARNGRRRLIRHPPSARVRP